MKPTSEVNRFEDNFLNTERRSGKPHSTGGGVRGFVPAQGDRWQVPHSGREEDDIVVRGRGQNDLIADASDLLHLRRDLGCATVDDEGLRVVGDRLVVGVGRLGRVAPVRDREMQPFTFESVRVGICEP